MLSPGCASFDWYGSDGAVGGDFARAADMHLAAAEKPGLTES